MSMIVDEIDLDKEEFVKKVETDLWQVPASFYDGDEEFVTSLQFLKAVRRKSDAPNIYVHHDDLPLLVKNISDLIDLDAINDQCCSNETGKEQEPSLHTRTVSLSLAAPPGVDETNNVLKNGRNYVSERRK
eukprot:3370118-Pleurochrysis_carterae.AAC.1